MKRLKGLEAENAKLTTLLAENVRAREILRASERKMVSARGGTQPVVIVLRVASPSGLATRREAVVVNEQFRRHNNDVRCHSSLGDRTPNEFKRLMMNEVQAARPT